MRVSACLIALLALATSAAAAAAGAGRGSTSAVFLLRGLRDPGSDRSLAERLGLDPERFYLIRRDREGSPDRIATRDPQQVHPVAVSPGSDLIAYSTWREASCDPAYSLRTRFAVVVDAAGEELAVLPGVWTFAWSPEGDRLAVVYGRPSPQAGYAPDSIGVIDIRAREGTTFPLLAAHLAWRDSVTLLLRTNRVEELDLRTHAKRVIRHRGWVLSPDARYSLSSGVEGELPNVADDVTGADLTARVQALLGGREVEITMPPFWVGGDRSGHLLCVPTARPEGPAGGQTAAGNRRSTQSVHIVDVAKRSVQRIIPGLGITATPDRRAIVVFRDGGFVFEDL